MYYLISQDYLIHHGVKGMKWGVRRYQNKDGSLTAEGRKKYVSKAHANSDRKYKIIKGVAIGLTGVAAAAVVGTYVYRRGLYSANSVLKAGTLVQNIAPAGRSFEQSFYGTRDKASAAFFKKQFLQNPNPFFGNTNRNTLTQLSSNKDINIAGRKEMDNALKELMKRHGADGVHINGQGELVWMTNGRKMSKLEFNNFWRSYGRTEPGGDARKLIEGHLANKGFGGFKDYNDIMIGWGNTPTVFFGKQSGLKVVNQRTYTPAEIRKIKSGNTPVTANGAVEATRYYGYYVGGATGLIAIDANAGQKYNNKSFKKYGKSYNKLNYNQQMYIRQH